tara:strand:- start:6572 stop:7597 length:1026 start_codon:yes stop_codon:yes gene_type:complete
MNEYDVFNSSSYSINTFNVPIKQGTVNPLTVKTTRQIININTRFRDNYNLTSATDFIVKLPAPIKNVISIKLFDYHLSDDNYTVSSYYNNNNFKITRDTSSHIITVPDGMYNLCNISTLTKQINADISKNTDISDISLNISDLNYKSTFSGDSSFNIDFSFHDSSSCSSANIPNISIPDQLSLGWILGFRGDYIKKMNSVTSTKQFRKAGTYNNTTCCTGLLNKNIFDISFSYDVSNSITSEGIVDLDADKHLLLAIDDYKHNHNNIFISPFIEQSTLTNNFIAKLTDDKTYSLNFPPRIYFGPTTIDKLHISLYDVYGRIYNNNYCDYSIELLIETIYDN